MNIINNRSGYCAYCFQHR